MLETAIYFIALGVATVLVFISLLHSEAVKIRKLMEMMFMNEMLGDEEKEELKKCIVEVMDE